MSDLFISGALGAEIEQNGNKELIRKSSGPRTQSINMN